MNPPLPPASTRARLVPWTVAMALSAACVSTPMHGPPVRIVDASAVQACTPLGGVLARSLRDSGSPAADLQRARERLLLAARERGATHLVINELDLRFAMAMAAGSAHRCE